MPLSALTLALGSALLHAAWNLLLGRARDVQAATAATFVLSILIALPFAIVWWHADTSVWPYALASSVLESVYVVALALAYRRSEVSFVYPITRGLAPLLVLAFAVLWLGHHASSAEVAGVLLVCVGVVLVGGVRGRRDTTALLLTATLAVSIAGYTLVDRVGIQHAGALTYFVLTLALPCLIYPPSSARERSGASSGGASASRRLRTSARSHSGCSRYATAAPPPCSPCARRRSSSRPCWRASCSPNACRAAA